MRKALQYFTDERLELDKKLSPTQIAQFLEDFRVMGHQEEKISKAISLRVDNMLLDSFKAKCEATGVKSYQKQIRTLMLEWLNH